MSRIVQRILRCVVGIHPSCVLKYVTHVAAEMHNTNKKQNIIHCEATNHRLCGHAYVSKKTMLFIAYTLASA